jgi:hypothetical protein
LVLALDAGNPRSYPGSGTTWFDISGNGKNCSWNSTPTFNTTHFTFNGSSNFGTISNINFSVEQTILIIMRHSYTSGRRNPWDQAYGGYGTWTHEQGNNINYYYGDAGANTTPYVGRNSGTTSRNVWNFMCTTRNTSQSRWYNGITNTDTFNHSYGTLTSTSANIRIGLGYTGVYWQGDMAMILAYTRALSADEVSQNYNALKGRFGL